jgi:very-short-patch-repair endonuclease
MSMRSLRIVAERQLGLVTSVELRQHLTEGQARTGLRRGWLVRVRPRVYRLAGAPPTWQQALLAAVLACGPHARVSHETAARLWALRGFGSASSSTIEITMPRGQRSRLPGIRVHQSTFLSARHVAVVERVPVTSAARTLCDLDDRVAAPRLGQLVDDLLARRALSIADLAEVHDELRSRRGRRTSRAMARVLSERGDEWLEAASDGEARVVRWLRQAGLAPVQQHAVDRYRIDLAYPEQRVFVEFDGFAPHASRSAFDGDRRRQNELVLRTGATILRFTSASTREEVVQAVTLALRRAG